VGNHATENQQEANSHTDRQPTTITVHTDCQAFGTKSVPTVGRSVPLENTVRFEYRLVVSFYAAIELHTQPNRGFQLRVTQSVCMSYQGVILDVDGTVVHGDEAIPGASEALQAIEQAGCQRVFISNNPTDPPAAYESRFEGAGLAVDREEVFTAGTVTIDYLTAEHADDQLYVIANPGFLDQLAETAIETTADPTAADALVASLDYEFDYEQLCETVVALQDGTPFIGTDPDILIPQSGPDVPGSGAIIHAIEGVAEREVDVICGKPSAYARRTVLEYLECPPEECLVVGDRLDTDITLGSDAGMSTAVVKTGITDDERLANSSISPDYVLDSIADIETVLD